MNDKLCQALLEQWCNRMLTLQITDKRDDALYGGILCPSCARVHGRCMDALYPFMRLADINDDPKFLKGAMLLFDWSERVVSIADGSYNNDTNSDWKGITVFSVIQLAEAILYHGHILDAKKLQRWKARLAKAAAFLYDFTEIKQNNINYPVTNALAMYYCGKLLGEAAYTEKAKESALYAMKFISEEGFLFGEGSPSDGYTARECRAIDIGYNVEESLPALAIYAHETGNTVLQQEVARAMATHVQFMLPDGGWDNSFGSRNFKWTYWGSRTSDGALLGLLLLAEYNPAFLTAAQRNLQLLSTCTQDGLLYGGPHYHRAGERPCVHHTFTHAKVLAGVLNHRLSLEGIAPDLPCTPEGITHFADLDTYRVNCKGTLATLTCYDWEYLLGGHASGGNVSMLWHPAAGPVLCASMSEYSLREPNNMQLPRLAHHACLTPALYWEDERDGQAYTTLYDFAAKATTHGSNRIHTRGQVKSINHTLPAQPLTHESTYTFTPQGLEVSITLSRSGGVFVCPIISPVGEDIHCTNATLHLSKPNAVVTLTVLQGALALPHGETRIYNLIPGLQAVQATIAAVDCKLHFLLQITPQ